MRRYIDPTVDGPSCTPNMKEGEPSDWKAPHGDCFVCSLKCSDCPDICWHDTTTKQRAEAYYSLLTVGPCAVYVEGEGEARRVLRKALYRHVEALGGTIAPMKLPVARVGSRGNVPSVYVVRPMGWQDEELDTDSLSVIVVTGISSLLGHQTRSEAPQALRTLPYSPTYQIGSGRLSRASLSPLPSNDGEDRRAVR